MRQADFEVFEPARGFRVLVHPTKKFKTIGLALYAHQPLGEAVKEPDRPCQAGRVSGGVAHINTTASA